MRFDFNVPLDQDTIKDTTRIDQSLETIEHILNKDAKKLIMMSHLGRPKGRFDKKFSLFPVAGYLEKKLNTKVDFTESALDSGIETLLGLRSSRIILLENLRFHPEEEAGDLEFAKKLAGYGDIYINDAFGTSHRRHSSTYQINAFFKNRGAAGLLIKKELKALEKIVKTPHRPFIAIIGGAKVSDKIKMIKRMLFLVDWLLIGGAMAYPFLAVKGISIGNSRCLEEDKKFAEEILQGPHGGKILLPSDHKVADTSDSVWEYTKGVDIPEGKCGFDIGESTIFRFKEKIVDEGTVFWNGPLGLFENRNFSKGTLAIAKALAESDMFSVVGGGDSINAINQASLSSCISHISTGGGAGLEYIEQGSLPGLEALRMGKI